MADDVIEDEDVRRGRLGGEGRASKQEGEEPHKDEKSGCDCDRSSDRSSDSEANNNGYYR